MENFFNRAEVIQTATHLLSILLTTTGIFIIYYIQFVVAVNPFHCYRYLICTEREDDGLIEGQDEGWNPFLNWETTQNQVILV